METKNQRIEINTAPVDAVGGAKPEPEERPAELKMDASAAVTFGQGQAARPLPPGAKDKLPVTITAPAQVKDMMDSMSTCATCKHFDHKRGQKIVNALQMGKSFEDRTEFNVVLLSLCPSGAGVEPSSGLPFIGHCNAMHKYLRDNGYSERESQFLTVPEMRCPGAINFGALAGKPIPSQHKSVSRLMDRMLNVFRDRLRFIASGRG